MTFLDRSDLIGAHPQSLRYYLTLVGGTIRTALDVGMLVAGTGLVALGVSVILDGLEIVDVGLGLGLGPSLGAGLVIAVCGGFGLGVASEGRYGSDRRLDGFPSLEIALGRLVGVVLVSALLAWAAGRLAPLVVDLPYPFEVAVEVVDTVASSGFVAALVGVSLAWFVRLGLDRLGWGASLEIPALYVTWLLLAILSFDVPT